MAEPLTIRPYQAEALDFLVAHEKAALFDDPGLGKTMQSLLAMRDLEPRGKLLVVTTGDALGVWRDEATLWLDEEVGMFAGPKPSLEELNRPHGIVITNYHRLAKVLAMHHNWDGLIFDESQTLRNRNTDTLFKSIRPFFDNQRYGLSKVPAFFLSATPIVKSAGDLWPILHLIDKRRWNAYWPFVQRYSIFWIDAMGHWHTEGITNASALWAEVDTIGLRRTIAEVQPYLPPKLRQRVPLTMTPRQARAYRELEKDMFTEISDGSLLLSPTALSRETRLRQLLVSPRLLGIDDPGAGVTALREVASKSDEPLVVFSPFPSAFGYIEHDLKTKRRVTRIHQGIDGNAVAKAFVSDAQAGNGPILLVSLQMAKAWSISRATNEGYMLGFDWNDMTMEQAERRIARDGQTKTVLAHYFVHQDTHDLDALDVLSGKRRLSSVIMDRKRLLRKRYHG